ncbi:MAG: tetratricopeptide repeat protein [Phototrophicaceae bacterium]
MSKRRRRTSGKVRKKKTEIHQITQTIQQGNLDKAILLLQSIKGQIDEKKRSSALAELYFQRAHRYIEREPKQALKDFKQAVTLQSDDALYAYHLALFQHRQGKLNDAIKGYRAILQKEARFERALLPLAFALQDSGQSLAEDAIWDELTEDQRALFTNNASSSDNLVQGLIAVQNQQWEQAKELLETVITGDNTSYAQALAHDYLGRIALQIDGKDLQSALAHWRNAYQRGLRSDTLDENLSLAYILYIEILLADDDIASALAQVQEAIKYFPENTRLQEIQSHLLLRVGYDEALENKWESARDYWESVKNAESEVARRLVANMAIAYEKLEMWGEAADSWREFARRRGRKEGAENWLSPDQVARLWSRISNLYMRVGMEDDAITTLQTALKYDPDDLDMGIDLARRYAESGRLEASHNQIDRVTKKHPKSAKAYAFKGEVSEVSPQGWGIVNHQAIYAWEKVIELDNESFDAIARQHLQEVYLEAFARYMRFSLNAQEGIKFAKEKLKKFPEFHMLRADLIAGLMSVDSKEADIQKQFDLIDVRNQRALHHLIDMCHIFDEHDKAKTMLQRADDAGALDANFYVGIGQCAIDREQIDIAKLYFDEASKRSHNSEEHQSIQVRQASSYLEVGMDKEGEAILKEVLKVDPNLGPAHLAYALFYLGKENMKKVESHLEKAERWAKKNHSTEMLRVIEGVRFQINNPLASMLPPGFDPSMLPPEMNIEDMLNMLDMLGFDDDFDDDEEDYF